MSDSYQRKVIIGDCTLYLGDCLEIMETLGPVDHFIADPPYEAYMHKAKANNKRNIRNDGQDEIKALDFDSIDEIRDDVAEQVAVICTGWSLIFCTPEGVGRWADAINATTAKYKRACTWIKPDSTPQLNGQGPAMGAEDIAVSWCGNEIDMMKFVASWCGPGFAKWNAGGKRGVYTHCTNPSDREGTHPTEKPWRLFRELIEDFSMPGQTILDGFMGSGTTGIACARTGRKFIGIEKDPKYFQLACDRINGFYGNFGMFDNAPEKPAQERMDLGGGVQ